MERPPSFYDDVAALESYLRIPEGALRNIPIYARVPAVDAIMKVKELEGTSLFRPGLYYIVLADLVGNTAFNAKYGDAKGDLRTEWFHTAVIQSIGDFDISNYVAFSKTIGDASLLIFSSFADVYRWSQQLSATLDELSEHYSIYLANNDFEEDEEEIEAFRLKARRLVHLGEVSYKEHTDPLSLAVSQTFKAEKEFSETFLGCTQPVADAIRPKVNELRVNLRDNRLIRLAGADADTMTYYVVPKD